MLKIIGFSIVAVVAGYLAGLFGGMFLVNVFSSNRHDKALEAAMTGAFICGPACAILALLATLGYFLLWSR